MKTKPMKIFQLPHEVRQAIDSALTYLWHDEEADYLACDEEHLQGHIFDDLKIIRDWLLHIKKSS